MHYQVKKTSFSQTLLLCVVLSIFSSFGLHAVQIDHIHSEYDHKSEGAEKTKNGHESGVFLTLGEYMHVSDKKLYFLIVSIWSLVATNATFLYEGWAVFILTINLRVVNLLLNNKERLLAVFDYIKLFFARGVLNPKSY